MNKVTLSEICTRLSSGKSIPASKVSDAGAYPVIGGNGIRGYTEEGNFSGECAVVGRQGAACGNVRYFQGDAYMTEHAVVVQSATANVRYLAYLLAAMDLGRLSAQSAQPGLSVKTLGKQTLLIPERSTQDQVAKIAGMLDEKIAANTKLNDYLVELCMALLKRAADGCPVESTVNDYCAKIYSGGTPSTARDDYWGGGIPWLSSGETRNRFVIDTEKTITELGAAESSTKKAFKGDIVMASAGQGHTRGQTSMLLFDTYINQSVVVMRPRKNCGAFLLFQLAASYDTLRAWSDSTSTRGSMSGKLLKEFSMPSVGDETLAEYEQSCSALIEQIHCNLVENKALAQLRDTLLPKLMSGEIDVSQVDITQLNNHLA